MLQSVGPQFVGATDLKSSAERPAGKDFKSSPQEPSFEKTLDDKLSSKSTKSETKESPPKEAKASEVERSQTVARPKEKKATVRQQAIQEFMDSFESEFQISPTRLVEAMAQLTDQQLTKAPEETADAVVSQLGLSDEDKAKASAMYSALLVQLNQINKLQQEQMQAKPVPEISLGAGVSQQHVLARKEMAESQKEVLASSLEKLNKKFWTNPEAQKSALEISPESMAKMTVEEVVDVPEAPEAAEVAGAPAQKVVQTTIELPPHLRGQMTEATSPALLAALAAQREGASETSLEMSQEPSLDEGSSLQDEFRQIAQELKAQGSDTKGSPLVQNKMNAQDFFQNGSQDPSTLRQQFAEMSKRPVNDETKDTSKITEVVDFKSELTGLENVHGGPIKGESLKAEHLQPTVAVSGAAMAKPENDTTAVKQIMNQAQYLIKKGGGEMKVQMTPEGLGTIHLKVMLQDGKVNVAMSADTHEAKKTIESSLAELKTSLAAQKLSMDNVKVEVVNSTSTDTATQNQTNMNGQQQRDQSRQFWNQFNENFGSQGRRESFVEMTNLRGYGKRERDPLQAIENTPRAKARSADGRGRELNLVA